MKYLLRPYRSAFRLGATLCLSVLAGFPAWAGAQSARITQAIEDPSPYLRSNSQGYLGVLVGDINQENATKLKLKETHGAVVTLIDHDAPAAQESPLRELGTDPAPRAIAVQRRENTLGRDFVGHDIT